MRRQSSFPVVLVLSAVFSCLAGWFFYRTYFDFRLDDAAIYEKVVKNLLDHGRWGYNLDHPTNPLTSFLYPLLLSVLSFITRSEPSTIAPILDTLLMMGAGMLLARFFFARFNLFAAILAPVLLPWVVPLGNFLGMETALVVLSLSALIDGFASDRYRRIVVSLLPLVRPEGLVAVGVEWGYSILRARTRRTSARELPLIISLALVAAPLVLTAIWNYSVFGSPVPRSVTNKIDQGQFGFVNYREVVSHYIHVGLRDPGNLLLGIVFLFGLWIGWEKRETHGGILFCAVIVGLWQGGIWFKSVAFYDWYLIPAQFLQLVLILNALEPAAVFLERRPSKLIPPELTLLVLSIVISAGVLRFAWRKNPVPRETRQVAYEAVAGFLREDHSGPGRASVAMIEAGHIAVGLPSDRFDVVDLVGLTTDNPAYYRGLSNDEFFCTRKPRYVVVNFTAPPPPKTETEEISSEHLRPGERAAVIHAGPVLTKLWPQIAAVVLDPRFMLNYEDRFTTITPGNGQTLKVFRRRDAAPPCEMGMKVRGEISSYNASNVYLEKTPNQAFDRNFTTEWNTALFAPQYVEVSFKVPQPLGAMALFVSQNPSGAASHSIEMFGADGAPLRSIPFTSSLTSDDVAVLVLDGESVSKIRVATTASPSWVGWKEFWFSTNEEGEASVSKILGPAQ